MSILTQYVHGDITVPAGTAVATPQITPVKLGDVYLHSIKLRVPPGHQGFTGISWQQAGSIILPFGGTQQWVILNDDRERFTMNSEVDSGFTVSAYNTDFYPHTFYILYELTPISAANIGAPRIVPLVPIVQ